MIRIFALSALLLGLLPLAAQAGECAIDAAQGREIAQATSQQRQAQGLNALAMDPQLTQAAVAQGCDMARRGFFAHTGSDGSTPLTRAERAGFHACLIAENVAMGQRDAGETFDAWMKSSGHRRNILLRGVTRIGVAVVPKRDGKGPWYVMVLAKPC